MKVVYKHREGYSFYFFSRQVYFYQIREFSMGVEGAILGRVYIRCQNLKYGLWDGITPFTPLWSRMGDGDRDVGRTSLGTRSEIEMNEFGILSACHFSKGEQAKL